MLYEHIIMEMNTMAAIDNSFLFYDIHADDEIVGGCFYFSKNDEITRPLFNFLIFLPEIIFNDSVEKSSVCL